MTTSEADTPWIVETTDERFEQDVFERSRQVPVVVDFWAAWCQPCRMLAPLLEQAAQERAGKFVLVKAETDHVPQAAMQFGVQAIPAVYGVCDGEIVDVFNGVLPAEQLGKWLDRLLVADLSAKAARLEATVPAAAEALYLAISAENPGDSKARIGLARALLAQEKVAQCREVIDGLAARGFLDPEAERVKAELGLHEKRALDLDAIRAAADCSPQDLKLKFQLAQALAGREAHQEAFDICLDLVRADRKGIGEEARQLMIEIFRVLPDDSELVGTYRRKLSSALY